MEFLSTCDEFLKEFDIISEDKSCYQDTRQAEMIELTKEHIKLLESQGFFVFFCNFFFFVLIVFLRNYNLTLVHSFSSFIFLV